MKMPDILDELCKGSIVCFSLVEDRKFLNVEEACDFYFERNLTKPEAEKLVSALSELVSQMEEPAPPGSNTGEAP